MLNAQQIVTGQSYKAHGGNQPSQNGQAAYYGRIKTRQFCHHTS